MSPRVVLAGSVSVLLLGSTLVPVVAHAAPKLDGTFALSSVGTNNQVTRGPDGNMWVTLDGGTTDVARVTPAGVVTEFDLDNVSNPLGIAAVGGKLWVNGVAGGGVASFSTSGIVSPTPTTTTAIAAVGSDARLVRGPDGNLWAANADQLVKIPPANPAGFATYASATTKVKDAKAITAAPDGTLWVADGLGGAQVVNVTTGGVGTAYNTGGGNQGIAAGLGKQVAFANPLANPQLVGRVTAGGTAQTRQTPQKDPFGVAFGADKNYWIAQFAGNDLARLTPKGTYSTPITFPTGAGPRQLAAGPGGTLWVTLDTSDKIARITGVTAPAPKPPQTTITKAPKSTVTFKKPRKTLTFRFTSSKANSTFQCRLTKKGKSTPAWKSCTSAKKYRVKTGRFTFAVRATAGGKTDPTPATAKVRVKR